MSSGFPELSAVCPVTVSPVSLTCVSEFPVDSLTENSLHYKYISSSNRMMTDTAGHMTVNSAHQPEEEEEDTGNRRTKNTVALAAAPPTSLSLTRPQKKKKVLVAPALSVSLGKNLSCGPAELLYFRDR
ncbi:hypothetical protein JOB18_003035 [Solea senegalensis]|uniref:Uncharacterized protein n=1 Tax=Solea senegalensis TaxID=28829 RepID=A0AAV6PN86_SOLSE|nr:hypothetical protein JOB18_003035 [Solea senegalensis]